MSEDGEGGEGGAGGRADAGEGGDSGAGGAAAESGCIAIEYGYHCEGAAVAHIAASGPVFTFDDGSALAWRNTSEGFVSPPAVSSNDIVTIDYTYWSSRPCPFCSPRVRKSLTIRSSREGSILWAGRNPFDGSSESELIQELFGVTVRREIACRTPLADEPCYVVQYDRFEHVLETTPPQRIPCARATHVSTPRGEFDMVWEITVAMSTPTTTCYDDVGPWNSSGFAVSRVAPEGLR